MHKRRFPYKCSGRRFPFQSNKRPYDREKKASDGSSDGSSKEQHNASPLVRMIVADLQPLSIIEGDGFRRFMRALNPGHGIPKGISSLHSDLLQLYDSVKRDVKASLRSANDVVLTSEAWTRGPESYQTVGCHFINHNWELKSYVLETRDVTGRNTGDAIFNQFQRISEEWEIKDRIHAVVMNGPNVLPPGSGWAFFPCFARTLDRVFKKALRPVDEAVLKKCQKVVRFLHLNSTATGQLNDSPPPYPLTLSGDIGWTSALSMLEKVSQQRNAINDALAHSVGNVDNLLDEDLSHVNNIVSALRLFEEAVKDGSQQNYVSISRIIPLTQLLKKKLGEQGRNGNKVAEQLAGLFTQQLKDVEINYKLVASTTLDARFKDSVLSSYSSADQSRSRLLKEILRASQSTGTTPVSPDGCPGGLWVDFDKKWECEEELRRYSAKEKIPRGGNPLSWWRFQSKEFPNLQRAAQRYLGIVSTCVPTARAFSKAGPVFSLQRLRLELGHVDVMMFLHSNVVFP